MKNLIDKFYSAAFFIGLLSGTQAFGYVTLTYSGCKDGFCCTSAPGKWSSNSATINLNTVSYPSGGIWNTLLNFAITTWNNSSPNFTFATTSIARGVGLDDGLSDAWFTANTSVTDGAPAIGPALFNYQTCSYDETDVVFATSGSLANLFWSSNNFISNSNAISDAPISSGNPNRHYVATALHELGHAMGLQHENRWYSIMGNDFETGTWDDGVAFYGPYEDGSRGAISLYSKRPSGYSDVGITPFVYKEADGQYSKQVVKNLSIVSGGVVTEINPTFHANSVNYWTIGRGQVVRIYFGPQNNSTTDSLSNVKLRAYLSTDDHITTADTVLGTWNFPTLSSSSYGETYIDVPIPNTSGIANTFQYIGLYINYDGAISDAFSSNNMAQWQIYVI